MKKAGHILNFVFVLTSTSGKTIFKNNVRKDNDWVSREKNNPDRRPLYYKNEFF